MSDWRSHLDQNFIKQLKKLENEMKKRLRQLPVRIGYPMVRDLSRKTPNRELGYGVTKTGKKWYSGRAAANWRVHLGTPPRNWIIPYSPDKVANYKETALIAKDKLRKIGRQKGSERSWIVSNPVFYIYYLNRGWSKKARPNYVDYIVAAHQRRLDKFLKKYLDPTHYIDVEYLSERDT